MDAAMLNTKGLASIFIMINLGRLTISRKKLVMPFFNVRMQSRNFLLL